MPSREVVHILGEGLFLEVFASPFFHVGTDALMHREYGRAAISYLVGCILAGLGLIVLGVFSLGPLSGPLIRNWIYPIVADPRWWLALLFFLLLWLGGPRWIEKTTGKANVRYWPLAAGVVVMATAIYFLRAPRSDVPVSQTVPSAAPLMKYTKWLSATDALEAFVPETIRTDLSVPSNNLRQQLQTGHLIARAYSREQQKYVQIPTKNWQFFGLVIRTGTTGGAVPGLSIEAGDAGLHYLGVELKQNPESASHGISTAVAERPSVSVSLSQSVYVGQMMVDVRQLTASGDLIFTIIAFNGSEHAIIIDNVAEGEIRWRIGESSPFISFMDPPQFDSHPGLVAAYSEFIFPFKQHVPPGIADQISKTFSADQSIGFMFGNLKISAKIDQPGSHGQILTLWDGIVCHKGRATDTFYSHVISRAASISAKGGAMTAR
jgi:hypothetical protein